MGTFKFELTLGRFIKKSIIRELNAFCFSRNLKIDIKEDNGWFDSQLLITITGDIDTLKRSKLILEGWFKKITTE